MLKITCGEKGYFVEIDGIESEAHRYGHACVTAGPSGTLYAACLSEEPEEKGKAQLYRLTPIDSITETGVELDADTEGGYVEDAMYDDEDEGDEVEDEDDGPSIDNNDTGDDEDEEESDDPKV